jgi:hypothetical protein
MYPKIRFNNTTNEKNLKKKHVTLLLIITLMSVSCQTKSMKKKLKLQYPFY